MADIKYIRTVTYGGYDKTDVLQRLESLNTMVFDLKTELRTTKLLLEGYKKDADEDKTVTAILAGEKTKMTQLEVQNETLSTRIKNIEGENKGYVDEIKALKNELSELKERYEKAESKIKVMESSSDAVAFSNVFVEAQKSADVIIDNSKKRAEEINQQAKDTAENIIAEANKEAENIIYNAEKEAADTIESASKDLSKLRSASSSMRLFMLDDIARLNEDIVRAKKSLEEFVDTENKSLDNYQHMLDKTEKTLMENKVPEIAQTEIPAPEVREKPQTVLEMITEKKADEADKAKKKSSLDKLKQMADALNKDKNSNSGKSEGAEKESSAPTEKSGDAEQKKSSDAQKKPGKIDLAALANQANSLKNK